MRTEDRSRAGAKRQDHHEHSKPGQISHDRTLSLTRDPERTGADGGKACKRYPRDASQARVGLLRAVYSGKRLFRRSNPITRRVSAMRSHPEDCCHMKAIALSAS